MAKNTVISVKKALSFTAGSLALGTLICQSLSWAQQSVPSESVEISQQIQEALRDSETLEQFRAHPGHPENILHRLIESGKSTTQVCEILQNLKAETLIELEEPLSHADATPLPCADPLAEKIANHWESINRKNQIDTLRARLANTIGTPKTLAKTEAIEIDSTKREVFYRGGLKNGQIALTFDDGPHPTRTRKILDILASRGVKATFFSLGKQALAHPELVQSAAKEGHSVGSHSKTHALLTDLSTAKGYAEIRDGHDAVTTAMKPEVSAPFFRFPYGGKNSTLQAYAKSQDLTTFFWNIDTLDWKYKDPKVLIAYIKKLIDQEKGGILLMHDIQEQTTIVLPQVLDYLAEKGITPIVFVPKR